jgi:hypothetical protein
MMWERHPADGAYRLWVWSRRIQDPNEGASVVTVLLVFYWDSVLFMDEDILSDPLRIEVCLWDPDTCGLLGRGKTDVVVQENRAGWWLEAYGCW